MKRYKIDGKVNGKTVSTKHAGTLLEIESAYLKISSAYPSAVVTVTDLVRKTTRPVDTNPVLL